MEQNILESRQKDGTDLLEPELEPNTDLQQAGDSDEENLEQAANSETPGVNVIKLFSSLLTTRPNKLECLYLAITFLSSLTFAGNIGSLVKKEASERSSDWVCSGLALKF